MLHEAKIIKSRHKDMPEKLGSIATYLIPLIQLNLEKDRISKPTKMKLMQPLQRWKEGKKKSAVHLVK